MAKHGNKGKAGIFKPWDGTLTGPMPGEPTKAPSRQISWGSVRSRQNKTFTLEEVQELVNQAVEAAMAGREIPEIAGAEVDGQEDLIIGGR